MLRKFCSNTKTTTQWLLGTLLATGISVSAQAQENNNNALYLIYDSSNSMWGALSDGSRKYEAARDAMREITSGDLDGRPIALRMYGHRRKNDCTDTSLEIPFSPVAKVKQNILGAMEAATPKGRTPIDASLRAALGDFGDRAGDIILISDGIESCDADPCALVKAWRDKNVNIKVHVVGLGLKGKERAAMQCIADASGTQYSDAFSTGELIDSLNKAINTRTSNAGKPLDKGEGNPQADEIIPDFSLVVVTDDGVRQRGIGTLTPAKGGDAIEVQSFKRFTPAPGDYVLEAGVQLISGIAYMPVTQNITIKQKGRTTAIVEAPTPPRVRANTSMQGEEVRQAVVYVTQNGDRVGSFQGDQSAFVPEGSFEFSTNPPNSTQTLQVTESFLTGDDKVLQFVAQKEVRVVIEAILTATGEKLLSKPAISMVQNGEEVTTLNRASGGFMFPGEYEAVFDDGLMGFSADTTITSEPDQTIRYDIPSGAVTVLYQDNAGNSEAPKRLFIRKASAKRRVVKSSNEAFALTPGDYVITGHPKSANYPETTISVGVGTEQTITLKAQN